jgi:type IV pilus assembly protein PilB
VGRAGNGSLAEALVLEQLATSEGIARALARRHDLPFVDLHDVGVGVDTLDVIPVRVLARTVALPLALVDGRLRVAIADPGNVHAVDELRLATPHPLDLAVASRADILAEIDRRSRVTAAQDARAITVDEALSDQQDEDPDADDGLSDGPLARLVNSIIFQAAEDGASDIHFEPQEDSLVIRVRVDGVLHEAHRMPRRLTAGVTTRLKVLAKLDIAERRKPQDGRISLNAAAAGRMLDIRVATLPTVEGESVVMRLLDKSKRAPSLEELGLSEAMRDQIDWRAARDRADGIGEVHHPLRRAVGDQPARDQHRHGRRPGRVPARRSQPDPDQPEGGPDVCVRAALDPAERPRRRDGRRDPGR